MANFALVQAQYFDLDSMRCLPWIGHGMAGAHSAPRPGDRPQALSSIDRINGFVKLKDFQAGRANAILAMPRSTHY